MATRKARRKKAEASSRGLTVPEICADEVAKELEKLSAQIQDAGGAVLGTYRDPVGGTYLAFAALPLETVAPTPFQRDLSDAHVKRLAEAIDQVGAFLDPIIAVHTARGEGKVRFWTPNGYHRLSALKLLGGKSITALVSPDEKLAYRILALNTEKAHNVKERCLEAVRMAVGLAGLAAKTKESEYAVELQEPAFVTLGFAYEEKPRFAGGAYAATLKASEAFLDEPIGKSLEVRKARAKRLLAIDERVGEIIAKLKERGFDSPYLRNFVVARIRPFRAPGKPAPDTEGLFDHMEKAVANFNLERVKGEDVAKTAGAPEE
jgi:ParB family chromosome partitioning protein